MLCYSNPNHVFLTPKPKQNQSQVEKRKDCGKHCVGWVLCCSLAWESVDLQHPQLLLICISVQINSVQSEKCHVHFSQCFWKA